MEIKPENLLKAYAEGCKDVKTTLQHLFPEFDFKPKPEWPEGYENYGAFTWLKGRPAIFVRKGIRCDGFSDWGGETPPEYDRFNFDSSLDAKSSLEIFSKIHSWVKTADFLND